MESCSNSQIARGRVVGESFQWVIGIKLWRKKRVALFRRKLLGKSRHLALPPVYFRGFDLWMRANGLTLRITREQRRLMIRGTLSASRVHPIVRPRTDAAVTRSARRPTNASGDVS